MGDVFSIGASLLGGASGSSAGSATAASGAAMIAAMEEIIAYTDEYREIVRQDTKDTRKNVNQIVGAVKPIKYMLPVNMNRAKGVGEFMEEGKDFSQQSYDLQTEQKREGLKFALGGADDLLRKAQVDFAQLASGDTSAFEREVKASAFGALAESAGLPMGAFANTSAKNLANFRQMGTENALGISDFFAKQGTVDPVDPLDSIFKLATFEREEDVREGELRKFNQRLEFERLQTNLQAALTKAGYRVDTENNILGVLADMEAHALDTYADALKFGAGGAGASELGSSQSLGAMGEAAAGIGQTLSGLGGGGGFLGGLFG